ncbi:hypothetical protein ACWC9U_28955 [Streptomyces sp. 900116325]
MRTHPATPAEVDSWLTVPHQHGHLHRAQSGPDTTWIVQREQRAGEHQRPGGHPRWTAA